MFFLPPFVFALFTGAIIVLGAWEWANMSGIEGQPGRIAYAAGVAVLLALIWQLEVPSVARSEEHTSELQSRENLVCRLLLGKKKIIMIRQISAHMTG